MSQLIPAGYVETQITSEISGQVSGQVAVGNHILQVGPVQGGVVNIAMPGQQPAPKPRAMPLSILPRPVQGMLDREQEINAASAALRSASPVELSGQEGIGKTTLLHYLAHHALPQGLTDGIAYHRARHKLLAELLELLYEDFYESGAPFKPTDAQISHALQNKRALVMLDDIDLERGEVQSLMDIAPNCVFAFTTAERRLWGEGREITVRGLPLDDSLKLVERELGRTLTPAERPAAQLLCTALEGHPLRLLQAAALAREGRSLAEMTDQARMTAQALSMLSTSEKQIAQALAALDDSPLSVQGLSALTGLADVAFTLEKLEQRGLVRSHSPRYSLTGDLGQRLRQELDLTPWAERVLTYFTTWAEQQRSALDRLLEEIEPILQILKWAVKAGRWAAVLRLVRAIQDALTLGRQWGAWGQVLQWGLEAARAIGDRPAEAWALHQLGTRALCLGESAYARTSLIRALRLRESLGDRLGAQVTRHNLMLLLGPPPSRHPSRPPLPLSVTGGGVLMLIAGVIAALVVGLIVWGGVAAWRYVSGIIAPLLVQPRVVSVTVLTPAVTWTVMPTATPTRTPTNVPTFTPTPTPCFARVDWPVYIVKGGDTLFSIARATSSTVGELEQGNCLTDVRLRVGQPFRVPRLPPTPTFTPTRTPTPTPTRTLTPTPTPTPTLPPAPDLVTTIQRTKDPLWVDSNDAIQVPVVVVVTNQGGAVTDTFKVSVQYTDIRGVYLIPLVFHVSGQDTMYPVSNAPIAAGGRVTLEGTVTLPYSLRGRPLSLAATADSCVGDRLMPYYCRVKESDESNNQSGPISLLVPACVDFEDLKLRQTYKVGESFVSSGVTITVKPFIQSNGTPTDGYAVVENDGYAGGSGNEMWTNSVNLDFDFGSPLAALSLNVGVYGGNLNININRELRNVNSLIEINGQIIGGVKVSIQTSPAQASQSPSRTRLQLSGTIRSFAIGGREFYIDDVCP